MSPRLVLLQRSSHFPQLKTFTPPSPANFPDSALIGAWIYERYLSTATPPPPPLRTPYFICMLEVSFFHHPGVLPPPKHLWIWNRPSSRYTFRGSFCRVCLLRNLFFSHSCEPFLSFPAPITICFDFLFSVPPPPPNGSLFLLFPRRFSLFLPFFPPLPWLTLIFPLASDPSPDGISRFSSAQGLKPS